MYGTQPRRAAPLFLGYFMIHSFVFFTTNQQLASAPAVIQLHRNEKTAEKGQ